MERLSKRRELAKRDDMSGTIARVFESVMFDSENLGFLLSDDNLMRVFDTIKEVGMTEVPKLLL